LRMKWRAGNLGTASSTIIGWRRHATSTVAVRPQRGKTTRVLPAVSFLCRFMPDIHAFMPDHDHQDRPRYHWLSDHYSTPFVHNLHHYFVLLLSKQASLRFLLQQISRIYSFLHFRSSLCLIPPAIPFNLQTPHRINCL
jgi:hypothetical protein